MNSIKGKTLTSDRKHFFQEFFQEFRQGLRRSDQQIMDQLIGDLAKLSTSVPPRDKEYSFREILLLVALVNEKKIQELSR